MHISCFNGVRTSPAHPNGHPFSIFIIIPANWSANWCCLFFHLFLYFTEFLGNTGGWTIQTCVHWPLTQKSWGLQWLCRYGVHWWRQRHQLQWAWWSLWTLYSSRRWRRCPNRRYWWGRTRFTASTRPKSPTKRTSTPHPSWWCRCAHCREMPTDIGKNAKPRGNQRCISLTGEFARLCLDNMVLEIAMRVHEDLVADDPDCNNAAYRHQAYRCYIYWQHGRLGQGNRRVTPSNVAWAIRGMWPEPTGIYKGFVPGGVGHLND